MRRVTVVPTFPRCSSHGGDRVDAAIEKSNKSVGFGVVGDHRRDKMDLRILGPLDISVDGRSVPLQGRRARVILAVLALDANRVVSVDRLVDAVWDECPPSTAREQIQICVSRLRTAFTGAVLPNIIVTRSPGYLLTVRDGELDADVFEDAVAHAKMLAEQGRLADAAMQLRAALELWRGRALEGLPGAAIEARARLLDEQRLAATEERIRLDLAL